MGNPWDNFIYKTDPNEPSRLANAPEPTSVEAPQRVPQQTTTDDNEFIERPVGNPWDNFIYPTQGAPRDTTTPPPVVPKVYSVPSTGYAPAASNQLVPPGGADPQLQSYRPKPEGYTAGRRNYLEKNGIAVTDENLQAFDSLYDRGIPPTQSAIDEFKSQLSTSLERQASRSLVPLKQNGHYAIPPGTDVGQSYEYLPSQSAGKLITPPGGSKVDVSSLDPEAARAKLDSIKHGRAIPILESRTLQGDPSLLAEAASAVADPFSATMHQAYLPPEERTGAAGVAAGLFPRMYGNVLEGDPALRETRPVTEGSISTLFRLLNLPSAALAASGETAAELYRGTADQPAGETLYDKATLPAREFTANLARTFGAGEGLLDLGSKVGSTLEAEHPYVAEAASQAITGGGINFIRPVSAIQQHTAKTAMDFLGVEPDKQQAYLSHLGAPSTANVLGAAGFVADLITPSTGEVGQMYDVAKAGVAKAATLPGKSVEASKAIAARAKALPAQLSSLAEKSATEHIVDMAGTVGEKTSDFFTRLDNESKAVINYVTARRAVLPPETSRVFGPGDASAQAQSMGPIPAVTQQVAADNLRAASQHLRLASQNLPTPQEYDTRFGKLSLYADPGQLAERMPTVGMRPEEVRERLANGWKIDEPARHAIDDIPDDAPFDEIPESIYRPYSRLFHIEASNRGTTVSRPWGVTAVIPSAELDARKMDPKSVFNKSTADSLGDSGGFGAPIDHFIVTETTPDSAIVRGVVYKPLDRGAIPIAVVTHLKPNVLDVVQGKSLNGIPWWYPREWTGPAHIQDPDIVPGAPKRHNADAADQRRKIGQAIGKLRGQLTPQYKIEELDEVIREARNELDGARINFLGQLEHFGKNHIETKNALREFEEAVSNVNSLENQRMQIEIRDARYQRIIDSLGNAFHMLIGTPEGEALIEARKAGIPSNLEPKTLRRNGHREEVGVYKTVPGDTTPPATSQINERLIDALAPQRHGSIPKTSEQLDIAAAQEDTPMEIARKRSFFDQKGTDLRELQNIEIAKQARGLDRFGGESLEAIARRHAVPMEKVTTDSSGSKITDILNEHGISGGDTTPTQHIVLSERPSPADNTAMAKYIQEQFYTRLNSIADQFTYAVRHPTNARPLSGVDQALKELMPIRPTGHVSPTTGRLIPRTDNILTDTPFDITGKPLWRTFAEFVLGEGSLAGIPGTSIESSKAALWSEIHKAIKNLKQENFWDTLAPYTDQFKNLHAIIETAALDLAAKTPGMSTDLRSFNEALASTYFSLASQRASQDIVKKVTQAGLAPEVVRADRRFINYLVKPTQRDVLQFPEHFRKGTVPTPTELKTTTIQDITEKISDWLLANPEATFNGKAYRELIETITPPWKNPEEVFNQAIKTRFLFDQIDTFRKSTRWVYGVEQYMRMLYSRTDQEVLHAALRNDPALAKVWDELPQKFRDEAPRYLVDNLKKLGFPEQGMNFLRGLSDLVAGHSSMLAQGLTTGILGIPNIPYHVMNFITAPAIIYQQLGARRALGSIVNLADGAQLMNHISKPLYLSQGLPQSPPVSTGPMADLQWRDIKKILLENNIGLSQNKFEFEKPVLEELIRYMPGERTAKEVILKDLIGAKGQTFWSEVATAVDNSWRASVFLDALRDPPAQQMRQWKAYRDELARYKDLRSQADEAENAAHEMNKMAHELKARDIPEARGAEAQAQDLYKQAQELREAENAALSEAQQREDRARSAIVTNAVAQARQALFDYGKVTNVEKKYISKFIWFYSFWRHNLLSTAQMLVSPKGLTRIKNSLNLLYSPEEQQNPQIGEPIRSDTTRPVYGKAEPTSDYMLYGPQLPIASSVDELTNVISGVAHLFYAPSVGIDMLKQEAGGLAAKNPYVELLSEIFAKYDLRRARPISNKLEPRMRSLLKTLGLLDDEWPHVVGPAAQMFNLKREHGGTEDDLVFGDSAGRDNYLLLVRGIADTLGAMGRTRSDYSKFVDENLSIPERAMGGTGVATPIKGYDVLDYINFTNRDLKEKYEAR